MNSSSVSYTLFQLAERIGAQLIGDKDFEVCGLSGLDTATGKQISFLSSPKYAAQLSTTCAGAVVLREQESGAFNGNALIVADPYLAYSVLSELFATRVKQAIGIHPSAVIDASATIASDASIGASCYVGANAKIGAGVELYPGVYVGERAQIGANSLLFAHVAIYHDVKIGSNVIIHANTSIGSDGFGFAPTKDGWQKIHQNGTVIVGNNVEIGANTAIDRGAIEDTVIEDGVIIDNQVHLAHNVKIGEGSAIAGCVGIAGSTELGKKCQVAGMVAINGHIKIADGSIFHGGTIVTKGNTEPGVFASASPLQDAGKWRKNAVRYRQLDDMFSRVKELEKQVKKLTQE